MAEMGSAASLMGVTMMLIDPAYFWSVTMEGGDCSCFSACYQRSGALRWTNLAPTAWQALAAAIAKTREVAP